MEVQIEDIIQVAVVLNISIFSTLPYLGVAKCFSNVIRIVLDVSFVAVILAPMWCAIPIEVAVLALVVCEQKLILIFKKYWITCSEETFKIVLEVVSNSERYGVSTSVERQWITFEGDRRDVRKIVQEIVCVLKQNKEKGLLEEEFAGSRGKIVIVAIALVVLIAMIIRFLTQ